MPTASTIRRARAHRRQLDALECLSVLLRLENDALDPDGAAQAPSPARLSAMPAPALHPAALSFDIEDWFHPELVRDRVAAGERRSVVLEGTRAILAALARHQKRATFFVLGEVAARHPELVCEIAAAGH